MFLGNRDKELMFRATHREVTAIATISLPGVDPKVSPKSFGAIIEDKKLYAPKTSPTVVFSQAATAWKFDDECLAEIETNPALLQSVKGELQDRTRRLNAGEFKSLLGSERLALFDSEDLVRKGTGIPSRLKIDFDESPEKAVLAVTALPFKNLRHYLCHLLEKASEAGGGLHDVVITHTSSVSAAEYNRIATAQYHPGNLFSAGHYMLVKADRSLEKMGVPKGNDPPKPRYH